MVKLGRLVRDNPIISAAVAELERRERVDEERLKRRVAAVSDKATACFKKLAEALHENGSLTQASVDVVRQLDSLDARTVEPTKLRAMLREHGRGNLTPLSHTDVGVFQSNVADRLRRALQPHEDNDPEISEVLARLDEFHVIANEAVEVTELEQIMGRLSIGRVVERIRKYAREWETRLLDEAPVPPTPRPPLISFDGFEHDVPAVVEFVAAQLEEGIARLHAVHRLRVLFEHFDHERLRSMLEDAKKGREDILQHEMDRFLFHEGYYPVTHAAASRGYLDTLLLERAEASGVPPLLIELKQVVAFANPGDASRKAVSEAVAEARGQVERYRGHVATRPQWAGLIPLIVVVHTCVADVSDLAASDVVLIDLSTASPSQKKARKP